MKIKHITSLSTISLNMLIALTGASCQASEYKLNPGEDFFAGLPEDLRENMTEFLDPKSLGRWSITSRRSAGDFRNLMRKPAYILLKTLLVRRTGNLQKAFFDAVQIDNLNPISVINYLIWNGVDINKPYHHCQTNYTALMLTASNGHDTVVNLLIKAKANLNTLNNSGKTALMLAAENGHEGIVDQLIKAGAKNKSAEKINQGGFPPASYCSSHMDF